MKRTISIIVVASLLIAGMFYEHHLRYGKEAEKLEELKQHPTITLGDKAKADNTYWEENPLIP